MERSSNETHSFKEREAVRTTKPKHLLALQYGLAVLAVILALQLTFLLRPLMEHTVLLLFFAAVVVVAWYGSTGPILLATFLAAVIVHYFFYPSIGAPASDWGDLPQLGVFMILALVICVLTAGRRRAKRELMKTHADMQAQARERNSESISANQAMKSEMAEHVRSEEVLRESESILRGFFDSGDMMRAIVELVDDDVLHITVNTAYAAFFGLTREAMRNGLATEIGLPKECLETWTVHCKESQRTAAPVGFDYVYDLPASPTFLLATVTFLGTAQSGRPRFAYVVSDVTERKRLEAQFRQAQKMEAVGVLAGGVAHDFNNLITVIDGYCNLLLNELPQDDPKRGDVEQIKGAGRRAASLTSQLLAFSRKQLLQPRILDLGEVVAETSKILRRLIGGDVDLVTATQPGLGLVKADPGQIEQIIMNLAVNARDAMPHGGKLTIETAHVDLDEDYVRKHAAGTPGPYVMLAVSDNGTGMDKETQSRIFEPFFSTKGSGKGTGLGLSTVYGIVKQSNGFIWVYSELGRGTTFKIYLPRVEGEADELADHAKDEARLGGVETVLIVEDDPSMRALTARVLCEQGYTTLEASNGREALRIAGEYGGTIHLVLTDVVMPEMSGKALVSQIATPRPFPKVLFVSGYPNNALIHNGVLDDNVSFLEKPFTADALRRKVREVLDSVP
jgi:signal transduction histidine kinase